MFRHLVEREARRELRRIVVEHRPLGFAEHLDVAQRKFIVRRAQVKIIHRERFLEHGRILAPRQRDQRDGVVKHVIPPDHVRAVRQAARMFVVGGHQQQPRRVGRAAGNDDDVAGKFLALAVALDDDFGDFISARAGFQFLNLRVGQQRHVRIFQRRPDRDDFGVRLGVNETGKSVAGVAANAAAVRRVRFIEQNAGRRERRMIAGALQIVGQFLDARLVADGRKRIRRARRRIGRIIAALAVDVVKFFRLRVIRLQFVVADRPVRRHAIGGAMRGEILFAQSKQRRAIHLGRAADKIMHARLKRFFVLVIPGVFRDVTVLDENFRRVPILFFARQITAAFQNENAFAATARV